MSSYASAEMKKKELKENGFVGLISVLWPKMHACY